MLRTARVPTGAHTHPHARTHARRLRYVTRGVVYAHPAQACTTSHHTRISVHTARRRWVLTVSGSYYNLHAVICSRTKPRVPLIVVKFNSRRRAAWDTRPENGERSLSLSRSLPFDVRGSAPVPSRCGLAAGVSDVYRRSISLQGIHSVYVGARV